MNLAQNVTEEKKARLVKIGKIALNLSAGLILAICLSCDFSKLFQNSDFISSLYVGAKLFAQGRVNEIYAPVGATTFLQAPFDIAAHQFLPYLAADHISSFNYCPLVAVFLAPLSFLSPGWALLVWQIFSVLALAVAIKTLVRGKYADVAFSTSLLFFPTAVSLWLGQTDLIFAVLPFAIGYRLLVKHKPVLAGLVFAIASLKPQMAVLPLFIGLVLSLKKEWRFLAGLAVGIAIMICLNLAIGGFDLFGQWLNNMRLCESVFTNPADAKTDFMRYFIIGLPGVLLLSLFKNSALLLKPYIYAFDALIVFFTAWTCLRFSKNKPDEYCCISYMMIIGLIMMPLILPNYLYYDATTLLIAGCIGCSRPFQHKTHFFSYIVFDALAWILLNVYGLLFLVSRNLAGPIFPLLVTVITYIQIVRTGLINYRVENSACKTN